MKEDRWFLIAVWFEVKPYLVLLLKDLILALVVLIGLSIFHFTSGHMHLPSYALELMEHLHVAGSICVMGMFICFSLLDIWHIQRQGHQ
jgi:hypothetical protein